MWYLCFGLSAAESCEIHLHGLILGHACSACLCRSGPSSFRASWGGMPITGKQSKDYSAFGFEENDAGAHGTPPGYSPPFTCCCCRRMSLGQVSG
jgi:hypothetical protein